MNDATCSAIMAKEDQGMMKDCMQNKLCTEYMRCLDPCFDKFATCYGNDACKAVYPSSEEEPTQADLQACAQQPLCREVMICNKVPLPPPPPPVATIWDGWTLWYDRDDPTGSADAEGIEYESMPPCNQSPLELSGTGSHEQAIESGPSPTPLDARCVRISDGMDSTKTGQVFKRPCGVKGLICLNADNKDKGGCDDYKVKYLCPTPDTSKDSAKCKKCAEDYAARGFCKCKRCIGVEGLCACGDRRRLELEPSFKSCESCEKEVDEYCKAWGPPPKRTCYSVGDPHVKQFDDSKIDSHITGWRKLYKQGNLEIQAEQAIWSKATGAAVNRAVRYSTDGGKTWDETIEGGKLLGLNGDSIYRYFGLNLPYETYLRVEKADYRTADSVKEKFLYNVYITTNTYLNSATGQCIEGILSPVQRRLLEGSGGVAFPTGDAVKVSKEEAEEACASLGAQKQNCITDMRLANDPAMKDLIKRDFVKVEETVQTLKRMGAPVKTTTTTTASITHSTVCEDPSQYDGSAMATKSNTCDDWIAQAELANADFALRTCTSLDVQMVMKEVGNKCCKDKLAVCSAVRTTVVSLAALLVSILFGMA